MRILAVFTLPAAVLMGCAHITKAPQPTPTVNPALSAEVIAAPLPLEPAPAATVVQNPPLPEPAKASITTTPAANGTIHSTPTVPTKPKPVPAAKPARPQAAAPAAQPAAPPNPVAAAPTISAATPLPAAASPPKGQLDLNSLEQRLRETSAIGVFTKLSLKNQVDDLLKSFRGYHAGRQPPTLVDLRQRYDGILLKVVTLLQDDDAQLASAISASRSAIWDRLSNKESFQAITS